MDVETIIRTIGVLGIAAIVFAESGLLIGFFLPGDTLLFAAGFLAQQGVLAVDINILVAALLFAAIMGYSVAYMFGERFGRRLFKRPNSLIFNHNNLMRAEAFYEKYGPLTVIIGRFVPFIRTFVPIVAGIGSMKRSTFLLCNIVGSILWIASTTYLGYFGGAWLQERGINVEMLVMPVILAVLLISLASPIFHLLHDRDRRATLLKTIRRFNNR